MVFLWNASHRIDTITKERSNFIISSQLYTGKMSPSEVPCSYLNRGRDKRAKNLDHKCFKIDLNRIFSILIDLEFDVICDFKEVVSVLITSPKDGVVSIKPNEQI